MRGIRRPGRASHSSGERPEQVAEKNFGEGQVVRRSVEKPEKGQDLADDLAAADVQVAEGNELESLLVEPGGDPATSAFW